MATAHTRQSRERIVRITIKMPPALHGSDRDAVGTNSTQVVDRLALQQELSRVVTGEVRFGDGDRGMYASDAGNYRMVPIGIVLPRTADDVVRATAVCRRSEVPIFARGGGTGIPGQTVNDGLLFDFSKYMNRLLKLEPEQRLARVQPGIILDTLRGAANRVGLTFGPDPATHSRCSRRRARDAPRVNRTRGSAREPAIPGKDNRLCA